MSVEVPHITIGHQFDETFNLEEWGMPSVSLQPISPNAVRHVRVAKAKAGQNVTAVEWLIRTERDRPIESRNGWRGAFPGIDQPIRPEPGLA
jgi:hypothetical protein